jgi:flagellar export protein FliJ
MAKQKYRLQALLTIKQRLKKKAEILLAKAIARLKEEREVLKRLEKEKQEIIKKWKEARKEMKRKMDVGGMVGEGNVYVNFLRKLKEDEEKKDEEIEEQKLLIEECKARVVAARQDYINAAKELQIMEKHKELWEKKVRQELSQKEAKEMDELGTTIHELRRWRGEKSIYEVK